MSTRPHSMSARALLWASVLLGCGTASHASGLQVAPALVDVTAPGMASTVTLRNTAPHPLDVQIRVFRWTQVDGKEQLEPTQDVVASPPAVRMQNQTDYTVRIVRTKKEPV